MARLVIWTGPEHDRGQGPFIQAMQHTRGDVVDILVDGAHVGNEVEASGWWQVVDMPGVAVSDVAYLLVSESPQENPVPRARAYQLDIDGLAAAQADMVVAAPAKGGALGVATVDTGAAQAVVVGGPVPVETDLATAQPFIAKKAAAPSVVV